VNVGSREPRGGVEEGFREALALHRQGRCKEAAHAYRCVLERAPRHVQALTFLGVIALQSNELALALELTSRAIESDPASAAAHLMQGHVLLRLERHAAAAVSYERVRLLEPDRVDGHIHHAQVLHQLGRHRHALSSFDRALELRADFAELHHGRGLVLHELGRYEEALASYDRAIVVNPLYAEAHDSRGTVLKDLRRLDAALASYERATALKPHYAQAHLNRGNVLAAMGRQETALASYDTALGLAPDDLHLLCNRGNLLGDLGRYTEALASFDRAIDIDAQHAQAYFSRAFVHLVRGDLLCGWRDFEWRRRNQHCATSREKRTFPQPVWLGDADIVGKTLLVHCEQGLGDTLQFCRYVSRVAELGARVVFEAPQSLRGLLDSLEGVAQCVSAGEPLPAFDYYCPLLSLPLACKTTLETIPSRVPYLRASTARERCWYEKLGERTRARVGLVWSGGFRPDQPELWSVNERRNIPLALLAPLAHPDVDFYSLQRGEAAEGELAGLIENGWDGPRLIDHSAELCDFNETAALIEQLDLVISVDTSTAHLAGALGKPVWILNRFDTCWRWLLDRADSPWYPSARLYRQETAGDWGGVVQRVRGDLDRFVRSVTSWMLTDK
jgi:tetratricopeptide (TPR) repeat protein